MVSRLQGLLLLTTVYSVMSSVPPVPMGEVPPDFMPWGSYEPAESSGDGLTLLPTIDTDDSMYDKPSARGGPVPSGPFTPGKPDMAFCDMILNAPVPPPIEQVPWFCVCSHCKGNVGPKGDRGDRGLTGRPGSPGRRGPTGFRGQPGFRGRQGLKGQKGEEGYKGDKGLMGFPGSKGARGYKGDKGDMGLEGPQGVQGPQGENGMCPESCDSVVGPPGVPGIPGPDGARGLPGLQGPKGLNGAKGDLGTVGAPGTPGLDGEKGDQGEQGICNCTDGDDGVDGQPGRDGPKGDKGDVGPQGPQGLAGARGEEGMMGMMGIPGPCSPAIQSAFSACISIPFPVPDLPVPFPHTHTNRQMDFDPMGGIYTAPVNGTYIFSYHLAVFGKVLKVGLFRNYIPIVKTTEATNMASASHQVVLHLNRFDKVWLQVKDSTTNGMYTNSESSSTFSGFLLHPDSCLLPVGGRHGENLGFGPAMPTQPYSWDGPMTTTTPTTPTTAPTVS